MAMIDYGAIAWKDGKLISKDMFDEMKDMVGWDDTEIKLNYDENRRTLKGNYFTYVGDEDLTVCFYKSTMTICYKGHKDKYEIDTEWMNATDYIGWKYFEKTVFIYKDDDIDMVDIRVYPRFKFGHNYYVFKMKYNGHKYKVVFGYGIDFRYYQSTHHLLVDYYGTPWHIAKSFIRDKKYALHSFFYVDVHNAYVRLMNKLEGYKGDE